MWKYLAIFAVFLLLAIYVARQDKRAATQDAHLGNGAVSAKTDEKHLQKDISDTAGYGPSWYGFFRWPNGTTTWGIILTLLAIAEQTSETRKSAQAAARGIEIQEKGQRAWLVIRSAMKDYGPSVADRQLRFWWTVENRGQLTGQIIETQCRYELVEDDPICNLPPAPNYPNPIRLDGFLIHPEGVQEYFTNLYRDGRIVVPPLAIGDFGRIENGTLHLRVYGYVKYVDGLEQERESRFIDYYAVSGDSAIRGGGFRALLGVSPEYTRCT